MSEVCKKCTKSEKMKNLFPLNNSKHKMKKRKEKKFKTDKQNTKEYRVPEEIRVLGYAIITLYVEDRGSQLDSP